MFGDSTTSLDLSGNTAQEARQILKPGRHACTVRTAKITTNAKSKFIEISFDAVDGSGSITARLNVWHTNADAQRIARDQLKALCVFGGHPNANQPLLAGFDPFIGLTVGVVVAEGKPYEAKNPDGSTKIGSDGKVEMRTSREVRGFYKLSMEEAAQGVLAGTTQSSSNDLDDEIPF